MFKGFMKDTWHVCRTIICHKLDAWGGVKCSEHKALPTLVGVCLLVGATLLSGGDEFLKASEWAWSKFATAKPAESGAASVGLAPHKREISTDAKNCNFDSGTWKVWWGKLNSDVEDRTYYSLPTNSYQGLYKYFGPTPDIRTCEFVFVPRSESAINYVVSLDGIYQLQVGDNDYWTVSLGASNTVGGPLLAVKELTTGKTRPRVTGVIAKGSTVTLKLSQDFMEDNKYRVEATVTYSQEFDINAEPKTEVFQWEFIPSPAIDLYKNQISMGLIRAKGDTS